MNRTIDCLHPDCLQLTRSCEAEAKELGESLIVQHAATSMPQWKRLPVTASVLMSPLRPEMPHTSSMNSEALRPQLVRHALERPLAVPARSELQSIVVLLMFLVFLGVFCLLQWHEEEAVLARPGTLSPQLLAGILSWIGEEKARGSGLLRANGTVMHCANMCINFHDLSWIFTIFGEHGAWSHEAPSLAPSFLPWCTGVVFVVKSSVASSCVATWIQCGEGTHSVNEWNTHFWKKHVDWGNLQKLWDDFTQNRGGRLVEWVRDRGNQVVEWKRTWGCETWAASHNRQTFGKACQSPSSSWFLKETKHLWALWIWILMPKRSWMSEAQSHKDFEMPGVDIFARNYNAEAMSQQPEECRGELLKKYKTLTQAWHEGVARWNCKISIEGINRSQMITDCWLPGIDPGHLEIVDLKVALCCPHELSETANMLPVLLLRNEFYRFYWTLAGLCWCLQGCTSPQRWQGNQLRNTEFKGSTANLCDKDPIPFSIDSVAGDRHMI